MGKANENIGVAYEELDSAAQQAAHENYLRTHAIESEWIIDNDFILEPAHEVLLKIFGADKGEKYTSQKLFDHSTRNFYFDPQKSTIDVTESIEVRNDDAFYKWLGIPKDIADVTYHTFKTYSGNTTVEFEYDDEIEGSEADVAEKEEYIEGIYEKATQKFDDHMQEVLTRIENEIDFRQSEEFFKEEVEANGWKFTEEGVIVYRDGGYVAKPSGSDLHFLYIIDGANEGIAVLENRSGTFHEGNVTRGKIKDFGGRRYPHGTEMSEVITMISDRYDHVEEIDEEKLDENIPLMAKGGALTRSQKRRHLQKALFPVWRDAFLDLKKKHPSWFNKDGTIKKKYLDKDGRLKMANGGSIQYRMLGGDIEYSSVKDSGFTKNKYWTRFVKNTPKIGRTTQIRKVYYWNGWKIIEVMKAKKVEYLIAKGNSIVDSTRANLASAKHLMVQAYSDRELAGGVKRAAWGAVVASALQKEDRPMTQGEVDLQREKMQLKHARQKESRMRRDRKKAQRRKEGRTFGQTLRRVWEGGRAKMARGGSLKPMDETENFYRLRVASPKNVVECAVPQWAEKAASSVHKGAKVTTCKRGKDGWFVQSVMIPKDGISKKDARSKAIEIKNMLAAGKKASGGVVKDHKTEIRKIMGDKLKDVKYAGNDKFILTPKSGFTLKDDEAMAKHFKKAGAKYVGIKGRKKKMIEVTYSGNGSDRKYLTKNGNPITDADIKALRYGADVRISYFGGRSKLSDFGANIIVFNKKGLPIKTIYVGAELHGLNHSSLGHIVTHINKRKERAKALEFGKMISQLKAGDRIRMKFSEAKGHLQIEGIIIRDGKPKKAFLLDTDDPLTDGKYSKIKKKKRGGAVSRKNPLTPAEMKYIDVMSKWTIGTLKDGDRVVEDREEAYEVAETHAKKIDPKFNHSRVKGKDDYYKNGGEIMGLGGITGEDAPRVYVASLSDYNAGRLEGEWFDLTDYSDGQEVLEAIGDMLQRITEKYNDGEKREEWAVHDYEYISSNLAGEYMGESDFDKIIKIHEAVSEADYPAEVIEGYINEFGLDDDIEDVIRTMDDRYIGEFEDMEDMAYQWVEEGVLTPSRHDLIMSDTDKRIYASEEADSRIEGYDDDELIKEADLEEEKDAIEAAENRWEDSESLQIDYSQEDYVASDTGYENLEELVEEAKEKLRDEWSSEIEDELDDPFQYFVEDYGIYSAEDLKDANFIRIDYKRMARELGWDHTEIDADNGNIYVFSSH